jgi:hypothetical protein
VKYNIGTQQRRRRSASCGNLKAVGRGVGDLAKARLGTDVVAWQGLPARTRRRWAYRAEIPGRARGRAAAQEPYRGHAPGALLAACSLPIDAITRKDVVGVVSDLEHANGKVTADRARAARSALYAWAIDRGYLDSNPTANIAARAQNGCGRAS